MATNDLGISEEMAKVEAKWHDTGEVDQAYQRLFMSKCDAESACKKVIQHTEKQVDPFTPGYNFANPWNTKKENKGKKEPPPLPKKWGGEAFVA